MSVLWKGNLREETLKIKATATWGDVGGGQGSAGMKGESLREG